MLTPSVVPRVTTPQAPPLRCCIIWRRALHYWDGRVHRCWDFFCRAPFEDAERIVLQDQSALGLSNEDYQVRQG